MTDHVNDDYESFRQSIEAERRPDVDHKGSGGISGNPYDFDSDFDFDDDHEAQMHPKTTGGSLQEMSLPSDCVCATDDEGTLFIQHRGKAFEVLRDGTARKTNIDSRRKGFRRIDSDLDDRDLQLLRDRTIALMIAIMSESARSGTKAEVEYLNSCSAIVWCARAKSVELFRSTCSSVAQSLDNWSCDQVCDWYWAHVKLFSISVRSATKALYFAPAYDCLVIFNVLHSHDLSRDIAEIVLSYERHSRSSAVFPTPRSTAAAMTGIVGGVSLIAVLVMLSEAKQITSTMVLSDAVRAASEAQVHRIRKGRMANERWDNAQRKGMDDDRWEARRREHTLVCFDFVPEPGPHSCSIEALIQTLGTYFSRRSTRWDEHGNKWEVIFIRAPIIPESIRSLTVNQRVRILVEGHTNLAPRNFYSVLPTLPSVRECPDLWQAHQELYNHVCTLFDDVFLIMPGVDMTDDNRPALWIGCEQTDLRVDPTAFQIPRAVRGYPVMMVPVTVCPLAGDEVNLSRIAREHAKKGGPLHPGAAIKLRAAGQTGSLTCGVPGMKLALTCQHIATKLSDSFWYPAEAEDMLPVESRKCGSVTKSTIKNVTLADEHFGVDVALLELKPLETVTTVVEPRRTIHLSGFWSTQDPPPKLLRKVGCMTSVTEGSLFTEFASVKPVLYDIQGVPTFIHDGAETKETPDNSEHLIRKGDMWTMSQGLLGRGAAKAPKFLHRQLLMATKPEDAIQGDSGGLMYHVTEENKAIGMGICHARLRLADLTFMVACCMEAAAEATGVRNHMYACRNGKEDTPEKTFTGWDSTSDE